MPSHRSCSRRSSPSTSRKTWCRCPASRSIRPFSSPLRKFRTQIGGGVDRVCEEEPGQGPLHQRRGRQLPALRRRSLFQASDIEMLHIPNKTGAAGMINDLVLGDAQVAFINAASTASMIKAGKLRPIAVLAEARLAEYPDVPTLAEAGYPGVGTLHWQSMLAPANTPKEVLATLF